MSVILRRLTTIQTKCFSLLHSILMYVQVYISFSKKLFMTFWPFLGPPVTESEKWIISSYASVTNQKPNQKPKYYLLIWFIWFIFSHCKCFWAHFWPFLSLQCLKLGPRFIWQMQYMDLNTKVYYLSEESAIKLTLIIDSVQCFSIFLCYGPFEPLGGPLRAPTLS